MKKEEREMRLKEITEAARKIAETEAEERRRKTERLRKQRLAKQPGERARPTR